MPATLLSLPSELTLSIFEELPSMHSTIALRLTCRHLDLIYCAYEQTVLQAQSTRLIRPMTEYYRQLTRLVESPQNLRLPDPTWDTPELEPRLVNSSPFARYVFKRLPFFLGSAVIDDTSETVGFRAICSGAGPVHLHDPSNGGMTAPVTPQHHRHQIALARARPIILDVMHAVVWQQSTSWSAKPEVWSCTPSQDFWISKRHDVAEGRLLFLPGCRLAVYPESVPQGDPGFVDEYADMIDAALWMFRQAGWPHNFDQSALKHIKWVCR